MLERASDEHVSGPAQLERCYVFYAAGFSLYVPTRRQTLASPSRTAAYLLPKTPSG